MVPTEVKADQAFWAKMRTDRKLITKMDIPEDDRYALLDAIDAELSDALDKRVLIYPRTLKLLGFDESMTFAKKKELLNLNKKYEYSESEQRFLDLMLTKAENGRKANWQWRISQEAEEKQSLGWYPFFVTLTVDPKKCNGKPIQISKDRVACYDSPKQLWKEGREFQLWLRKLTKIVTDTMGHPPCNKPPYRKQSEYLTYAGVIEHGSSREHHHGHFIVWMRDIPSSWKQCPNKSIMNPANRKRNECKELSIQWKWSGYDPTTGNYLSPALYYRTVGDIYSTQCNFVIPLKEGKPMQVSNAGAAGRYITKYLQKEHRQWHHRMKATRNLGMMKLKEAIQSLDPYQVECLTFRPKTSRQLHSLSSIHSVPLGLMRSIAKQINYWDRYRLNMTELREHLRPSYDSFTRMLQSVRAGARPDRMHSLVFYDFISQFLPDQKGFCEEDILETHRLFSDLFSRSNIKVKSIKIGANNSGST